MENFDALALHWDEQPRRVERARAVAAAIISRVPDLGARHAFEYGCGTGLLSLQLQPLLKDITLGDNSPGMLAVLEEKIRASGFRNMHPLKIDLATEPIPRGKYDLIYTMMTLHHISDTDRILAAFYEMLTPMGHLCIADLDAEDGSFHEPDFIGHHGFKRLDLEQRLTELGYGNVHTETCFQNLRADPAGSVRSYPMFLMACQKILDLHPSG